MKKENLWYFSTLFIFILIPCVNIALVITYGFTFAWINKALW